VSREKGSKDLNRQCWGF